MANSRPSPNADYLGGKEVENYIRERGIKEKPLMRQVIYVKGLSFHFLFSANKQNFPFRSDNTQGTETFNPVVST